MVSQKLLTELDQILKEDYQLALDAYDLSNLGNSLTDFFATLTEIVSKQNHDK